MGHGNHWQAIFPDVEKAVTELIPEIIAKGSALNPPAEKYGTGNPAPAGTHFAIAYPAETPLGYMVVVEAGEESNFLVTAHPAIRDGEISEFDIQNLSPQDEGDQGFEAIVTAIASNGCEYSFFEPRFPIHKTALTGRRSFELGALAYSIEKAKTELEITAGPLVEMERERVSKEGGDPAGVQSVSIYSGELRCYFHHGQADFEFQSVVEEVSRFHLLDQKFLRLKILLSPVDEGAVPIALYVSEKAAGGLEPKVGDAIMGVAWLQGIAVDEAV